MFLSTREIRMTRRMTLLLVVMSLARSEFLHFCQRLLKYSLPLILVQVLLLDLHH